ncbi:MAG: beta-lactamase family protein [Bradymonadaceae bacterium]|nr:beta-lactamase family protein [Lujinxingiaceae bacterium]
MIVIEFGDTEVDAADAVFGVDAEEVEAAHSLDEMLEPIRLAHGLPGLAAAVLFEGNIVAVGAAGRRKLGDEAALTVDDRFHLGSCTKAMTATLAARLVGAGVIGWETTLAQGFAHIADEMNVAYRDVTLVDLLSHRAGFAADIPADIWGQLWSDPRPVAELRAWFAQEMLTLGPSVTPQTQVVYSNAGFMIAGAMLEHATGRSWEALIEEHLFAPLEMTNCGFGTPATVGTVDAPWGHAEGAEGAVPVAPGPGGDNPRALGPAGTVHCSLADWAKFAAVHVAGARQSSDFLSAQAFETLHAPRTLDPPFALGWLALSRSWAGGIALHHTGSNTMFYADLWLAPARDIAFMVVTNRAGPTASAAAEAVYGELIPVWVTQ